MVFSVLNLKWQSHPLQSRIFYYVREVLKGKEPGDFKHTPLPFLMGGIQKLLHFP